MTHNSLPISARISTIIEIDRYDGVLLLNEQGGLYILFRYAPHYGLNLHTSFGTNKPAVTFQSNCKVNEDGT